jgi:hypothetical protein
MTIVLELTEKQQERLQRYAAQVGKNPQTIVREWVDTLPEPPETGDVAPARVAGLFAGQLWIGEDFDDPLPDSFWFPDEQETPPHAATPSTWKP